jgi:hypothetical protein
VGRPIDVIFIESPDIRTKHGLHIGSSLDDVKKLGGEHAGGDYWMIHGFAAELVFIIDKVTVGAIMVQPEGARPQGGFGPCS